MWRPDLFGSDLFLVASASASSRCRAGFSRPAALAAWWIAWVNMLGSVLFMASALASYVLPSTDELVSARRRSQARSSARCASWSAPP